MGWGVIAINSLGNLVCSFLWGVFFPLSGCGVRFFLLLHLFGLLGIGCYDGGRSCLVIWVPHYETVVEFHSYAYLLYHNRSIKQYGQTSYLGAYAQQAMARCLYYRGCLLMDRLLVLN